ncbi:hypothetical protein Thexy_2109 [Thermoanaerobacterium xylanolyticum LX-11]|uniref:Uncharacterized protein n=1 Tax=Thermoanaerobacterium xylanolyticum (strain ATCC 49914 / DSM 7097 / LX-11) TaxID=858215 RepID=F6BKH2_THEXL|nr:hypothetical protein Thexy_2109 [Thermoanaerobacterium xylanolyticum LX-11]
MQRIIESPGWWKPDILSILKFPLKLRSETKVGDAGVFYR